MKGASCSPRQRAGRGQLRDMHRRAGSRGGGQQSARHPCALFRPASSSREGGSQTGSEGPASRQGCQPPQKWGAAPLCAHIRGRPQVGEHTACPQVTNVQVSSSSNSSSQGHKGLSNKRRRQSEGPDRPAQGLTVWFQVEGI